MNAVVTTEVDRIEELKFSWLNNPLWLVLNLRLRFLQRTLFLRKPRAKYKVAAVDLGIKKSI